MAGAGAGLLGSFAHAATVRGLPLGLAAALGLCLAVFLLAGLLSRRKGPVGLAAGGWVLVVLLLSVPRPEGDLVVPATPLGYAWLLGGAVVAVAAVLVRYAPTAADPAGR